MRERARARMFRGKKKIRSFSKALYLVRRSAVLVYLSANEGKHLTYDVIAKETAVPLRAVRRICEALERSAHEGFGPDQVGEEPEEATA